MCFFKLKKKHLIVPHSGRRLYLDSQNVLNKKKLIKTLNPNFIASGFSKYACLQLVFFSLKNFFKIHFVSGLSKFVYFKLKTKKKILKSVLTLVQIKNQTQIVSGFSKSVHFASALLVQWPGWLASVLPVQ